MLSETLLDPKSATRKDDLIPLALLILAHADRMGLPGATSPQLRRALSKAAVLSDADRATTPSDTVSRFDRTVLNLVSHNNLTRNGWVAASRPADPNTGPVLLAITEKGKARLLDSCIDMLGPEPLKASEVGLSEGARHTERQLTTVALLVLAWMSKTAPSRQGKPTTVQLRDALKAMVATSDLDRSKTSGDTVSRFERTVLNLISHGTLTKEGWARRVGVSSAAVRLEITDKGRAHLLDKVFLQFLPCPDLSDLQQSPIQQSPIQKSSFQAVPLQSDPVQTPRPVLAAQEAVPRRPRP